MRNSSSKCHEALNVFPYIEKTITHKMIMGKANFRRFEVVRSPSKYNDPSFRFKSQSFPPQAKGGMKKDSNKYESDRHGSGKIG